MLTITVSFADTKIVNFYTFSRSKRANRTYRLNIMKCCLVVSERYNSLGDLRYGEFLQKIVVFQFLPKVNKIL